MVDRYRLTARDNAAYADLDGKVCVVTGGSSGLGIETARAFAERGAHTILAVRNLEKGAAVAEAIRGALENSAGVECMLLDLSSLQSVRNFAEAFISRGLPLHYLLNNAGVMACPYTTTEDGFEMQFGTNHLGHFLLTNLLSPVLVRSQPSRVVMVSSCACVRAGINWDDINFTGDGSYNKWRAYSQSKSANVLFAKEFNSRFAAQGVLCNAVHPGPIMTGLQKSLTTEEMGRMGWLKPDGTAIDRFKTPEQGAATTVYAALHPEMAGVGGHYCENSRVSWEQVTRGLSGLAAHVNDTDQARKLWEVSEEMVGASFPGSAPRRVLVTGASGFIGSHVTAQLLALGYDVVATVRDSTNATKTDHLTSLPGAPTHLTLVSAELQDPNPFHSAVTGCDAVIHLANPLPGKGDTEESLTIPALEGTRNLLAAVEGPGRATVRTLVVTSSIAAVLYRRKDIPADTLYDENTWSDEERLREEGSWYSLGKTLAEKEVWAWAARMDTEAEAEGVAPIRVATVLPSLVFGPLLSPSLNASSKPLAALLTGATSGFADRTRPLVDVRDTARAHVLALEHPDAKGRLLCSPHSMAYRPMAQQLATLLQPPPSPTAAAEATAAAAAAPSSEQAVYHTVPQTFPPLPEGESYEPLRVCTARLQQLGLVFRPLSDTLRDASLSLMAKGFVTPTIAPDAAPSPPAAAAPAEGGTAPPLPPPAADDAATADDDDDDATPTDAESKQE